jgi:Ala-tRNA(Pro) deacylase
MKNYTEFLNGKYISKSNLEFRIFNSLNNLKCEYYIHEHPALKTVEESKILRGKMEGGHSKNLFLRDKKKNNFLITACEDQKIDLKDLEKKLGTSRLTFGSPDRLYQFLGVKPGSVSPLALINDQQNEVSFYIDKNLLKEKILNFHPLINNLTISLKTKDFEKFLHSIKRAYNELFFK